MGKVLYTVKRNPVPGHAVDDIVELDIDFRDAVRSRRVNKEVHRASGGPTETIYFGADTNWALTFGPFPSSQKPDVREFLDSVAEGETFRIWIYNEEDSPGDYIDVARMNSSWGFNRIRTAPERDDDLNQVEISAMEIEA